MGVHEAHESFLKSKSLTVILGTTCDDFNQLERPTEECLVPTYEVEMVEKAKETNDTHPKSHPRTDRKLEVMNLTICSYIDLQERQRNVSERGDMNV